MRQMVDAPGENTPYVINSTNLSWKMKQETVVQVHKIVKTDNTNDKAKRKDDDRNENRAPSRDVSVDEESQINSKILSLIESEMIRDANKHTHFTESRPQSLSFYEDEKAPEELSGNLELLSPEERKHFKRRRDYSTDDLNAYNVIQDLYKNNSEENLKKSKWRKKQRHGDGGGGVSGSAAGDNELGDSRETMLPKEKKKNKKKKRESASPNNKRKHKKRLGGDNDNDNDNEPPTRTDIVCTLDELQDDVFENNFDDYNSTKFERKSPKKSDNLYVQQKKNKYKHVPSPKRNNNNANNKLSRSDGSGNYRKFNHPLDFAVFYQKYWIRFSTLCHGLLAGLGFGHWLYILSNIYVQNQDFISHYSHFSEIYVSFFYFFCIVCIISVCEKTDIAQFTVREMINLKHINKNYLIILIYFLCLIIHLIAAKIDYKFTLSPIESNTTTVLLITEDELVEWNHLSSWRSILAFISWIIVGLLPPDNSFYYSLQNLEKFKK